MRRAVERVRDSRPPFPSTRVPAYSRRLISCHATAWYVLAHRAVRVAVPCRLRVSNHSPAGHLRAPSSLSSPPFPGAWL